MHKYLMVGLLGLAQSSLAGDQSAVAAELVTSISPRKSKSGLSKFKPEYSSFGKGSFAKMLQVRLSAAHNQEALDAEIFDKGVVGAVSK